MPRDFCTAGPVDAERHYRVPPLERAGLEQIRPMIREQCYFVLYAPRQTGKTTALRALAAQLRGEGVRAVYANVEPAQTARNDVSRGVRTMLACLAGDAGVQGDTVLEREREASWLRGGPDGAIKELLQAWAGADASPAVLFLDEVDALVGDVLVSLLRQIRAGYPNRPGAFPLSVVLCGVRDVKDYRIHTGDGEIITGGSCFNIKDDSLRIGDFDRRRMEALYAQHTADTGQVFTPEALELAWRLTQGQPWLVNALGREVAFRDAGVRDSSQPITAEHVNDAKERLILSRCTHLDQLADKLTEERVRRVVEPILLGEQSLVPIPPDDRLYVRDLGLIRDTPEGWVIANPMYREVLPRELTWSVQQDMKSRFQPHWITPDGRIDGERLIAGFQEFYGENGRGLVRAVQLQGGRRPVAGPGLPATGGKWPGLGPT